MSVERPQSKDGEEDVAMTISQADPQADRWIKEHGGITGIDSSFPAGVTFQLGDGHKLTFWEGSYEHSREWELIPRAPDS